MSRTMKKGITSLSYSMNKAYRRISTVKPSAVILSTLAVAFAVFMFSGGLYDIIMKPFPAVYYSGRFIFLYPQLSEQFISDSLIAMIMYSLGIIGLIAMYQSTKYAYKPRQAWMMFLMGITLLFLAYVLLETTIELKLSG
jgi:hypothetical protein